MRVAPRIVDILQGAAQGRMADPTRESLNTRKGTIPTEMQRDGRGQPSPEDRLVNDPNRLGHRSAGDTKTQGDQAVQVAASADPDRSLGDELAARAGRPPPPTE